MGKIRIGIVIFAVILVTTIIGSGIYVWQQVFNEEVKPSVQVKQPWQRQGESNGQVDYRPSAILQRCQNSEYANKKHGFVMGCPDTWYIYEKDNKIVFSDESLPDDWSIADFSAHHLGYDVAVFLKKDEKSLLNYNELKRCANNYNERIIIGENQRINFYIQSEPNDSCSELAPEILPRAAAFIENEDYGFYFDIHLNTFDSASEIELLKDALAKFRFIN